MLFTECEPVGPRTANLQAAIVLNVGQVRTRMAPGIMVNSTGV
jgi:hypothetical protein